MHSKLDDEFVFEQLKTHNSNIIERDLNPVSLYFKDENEHIVAGLTGKTQWGGLLVDILWVHEDYRGQSLGTKLLDEAESIARKRNCENIVLDTMGFQAKEFYLKQGFQVFGIVENSKAKLNCYYMKKVLNQS